MLIARRSSMTTVATLITVLLCALAVNAYPNVDVDLCENTSQGPCITTYGCGWCVGSEQCVDITCLSADTNPVQNGTTWTIVNGYTCGAGSITLIDYGEYSEYQHQCKVDWIAFRVIFGLFGAVWVSVLIYAVVVGYSAMAQEHFHSAAITLNFAMWATLTAAAFVLTLLRITGRIQNGTVTLFGSVVVTFLLWLCNCLTKLIAEHVAQPVNLRRSCAALATFFAAILAIGIAMLTDSETTHELAYLAWISVLIGGVLFIARVCSFATNAEGRDARANAAFTITGLAYQVAWVLAFAFTCVVTHHARLRRVFVQTDSYFLATLLLILVPLIVHDLALRYSELNRIARERQGDGGVYEAA